MSRSFFALLCYLLLPSSLLFAQKLEWKTMGPMPPSYEGYPIGISLTIAPNGAWYATSMGSGVWRSIDSGQNWNRCNGTMDTMEIGAVYAINSDLFASHGYGQHLYKSTDNGQSWHSIDIGVSPDSVFYAKLFHRAGLIYLYGHGADSYSKQLKVSSDQGHTWENIEVRTEGNILDVAFDSSGNMIVCDGYVYRSKNTNGEWERLDIGYDEMGNPIGGSNIAIAPNGQLWLATSRMHVRQEGKWRAVGSPYQFNNSYQLAINKFGELIYSGSNGFYTSTNYGETWLHQTKNIQGGSYSWGLFILQEDGLLLFYTPDSIYRSTRSLYTDTVELPEGPIPCLPKRIVKDGPVQDIRLVDHQLLFGHTYEIATTSREGGTLVMRQTMQPEKVGSILTKDNAYYFSTYGIRYGGEDRGGVFKYVAGPNAPLLIDLTNVIQIEERDNYLYLLRAGRTVADKQRKNGEIWRYNLDGSQSPELLIDSLHHPTNMVVIDSIFFGEYGNGEIGSFSRIPLHGGQKDVLTTGPTSRVAISEGYIYLYSPFFRAIVRAARDRSSSNAVAQLNEHMIDMAVRSNKLYYLTNDGCESDGKLVCVDLVTFTSTVISSTLRCPNKLAVDDEYIFVAQGSLDSSIMRFCVPSDINTSIDIASSHVEFGKVSVSESKTESIVVRNDGEDDITVYSTLDNLEHFVLSPPSMEIPAHCSASFKLRYVPKSTSKHYATAFFNSETSPVLSVQIEGEGRVKSEVRMAREEPDRITYHNGFIKINGDPDEWYDLSLFDITGRKVFDCKLQSNVHLSLQERGIINGIYFVKARTDTKEYSFMLITK